MACHVLDWNRPPPDVCRRGAVSIGNFDGVHLGHATLVRHLRDQARACDGPAIAVTFDPHPLKLLRPDQFQPVLTTLDDRAALLQQAGADHVIILQTTADMLLLSAEEFFRKVIREQFEARIVVEGVNFSFGCNREGNVDGLRELCRQAGIGLSVVPPFTLPDGRAVSSSRARAALCGGDVRGAADLLGRPYRCRGVVATGQRRGRDLGFPTANLENLATLVPREGVYAVRARLDGNVWPAAANVGPNPTFGEFARKVEVHLIDFQGDLYGRPLAVDFVERLRDVRPFAGVAALVEQLRKDVDAARRLLGKETHGPRNA